MRSNMMDQEAASENFDANVDGRLDCFSIKDRDGSPVTRRRQ